MRSAAFLLCALLLCTAWQPSSPERQRYQRRGGAVRAADWRPHNKPAKIGQTYSSRLKRKGLAVDFTFSPFFRNYLLQFFGRARNADCRLVLDCDVLGSSLEEGYPPARADSFPDLPSPPPPPPSKRRSKKQPNQVVLEVGWADTARCGHGGDPGTSLLIYNLTQVFLRWSASTEGRLRIRLMPEKRTVARYPKREEIISAAIRSSEPRVWLQISFAGERGGGPGRSRRQSRSV